MGSDVYRKYLLLGAVTLPFTLVVLFANDLLRVTFQPWKFIALNLAQTVLTAGLSLWLVLAKHMGVAGVLYGRLAGDAACALFALVLVRHTIAPRFSAATLRRMLGYGAPLVPVAIAYGAITSLDRYVLQRTRSLEDVAVYGVAIKFFALVTMAVSAFQLAYGPFAFARASSPDAGRLYARVLAAYVAAASLAAMLAGLFAPEALAVVVPPAYAGAAGPAAFLAFAAVAQGAYYVVSVGIGLALKTPLLGWAAGGAAVVAAVANLLLAPRLGPLGAGIATTLGYVTSAVLTYVVAQRVHPVPFRGAAPGPDVRAGAGAHGGGAAAGAAGRGGSGGEGADRAGLRGRGVAARAAAGPRGRGAREGRRRSPGRDLSRKDTGACAGSRDSGTRTAAPTSAGCT